MKNLLNRFGIKIEKKFYFIGIIGLLTGLSSAFISTIWALYLHSFIESSSLIAVILAFLTTVTFVSYFLIIPIIEKYDKAKLYLLSLLVYVACYLVFSFFHNFYLFLILAFFISIFAALRVTCFGILVKDFSKRKDLVKNEGFYYALENIAWVLGPLIAGFILSKFDFSHVFFLSSLFLFFAFFVMQHSRLKDKRVSSRIDGNYLKNFLDFFRNKKRIFAYLLAGGVNVWWSLIYVFIPLYIIDKGLNEVWVGYFLFAVAVPLVFLEYKFSLSASTQGFRKLFQIGYFVVFVSVILCFWFSNIYLILLILFFASFGMAMLEPTTEAYFFDMVKDKEDLKFYGPFKTAGTSLSAISKLFAGFVLFIFPFKFVFLLYGLFMFGLFFLSFFIKDYFEYLRSD